MPSRGLKGCMQTTSVKNKSTCLHELDQDDAAFQWTITPDKPTSGQAPTTSATVAPVAGKTLTQPATRPAPTKKTSSKGSSTTVPLARAEANQGLETMGSSDEADATSGGPDEVAFNSDGWTVRPLSVMRVAGFVLVCSWLV
jgi:hypothetical protein